MARKFSFGACRGRWSRLRLVAFALAVVSPLGLLTNASELPAPTPTWWSQLQVFDLQGKPVQLPGRWFVVIFLGQECPVSNASLPRLNELADEFERSGVTFVGAYVDPAAPLADLREHAAVHAIRFRVVDDREQRLARVAMATYTPEVVVFSSAGKPLYRGALDDRVGDNGQARPAATQEYLREVLRALLAGDSGPFPNHRGFGCALPELIRR